MTDAVVVTDLDRRVVVWNDAADRLYGIPASEALGRADRRLFDYDGRRRGHDAVRGPGAWP